MCHPDLIRHLASDWRCDRCFFNADIPLTLDGIIAGHGPGNNIWEIVYPRMVVLTQLICWLSFWRRLLLPVVLIGSGKLMVFAVAASSNLAAMDRGGSDG